MGWTFWGQDGKRSGRVAHKLLLHGVFTASLALIKWFRVSMCERGCLLSLYGPAAAYVLAALAAWRSGSRPDAVPQLASMRGLWRCNDKA